MRPFLFREGSPATCTESERCDARDCHAANEATSEIDEHIASIVNSDVGSLERSKAEHSHLATPVVAGFVTDENAGLPRVVFLTTDFTGSTDTSDEQCVSGVRTLSDFFGWAQPLIDDIGASDANWIASIAFCGTGCPSIGGFSFEPWA